MLVIEDADNYLWYYNVTATGGELATLQPTVAGLTYRTAWNPDPTCSCNVCVPQPNSCSGCSIANGEICAQNTPRLVFSPPIYYIAFCTPICGACSPGFATSFSEWEHTSSYRSDTSVRRALSSLSILIQRTSRKPVSKTRPTLLGPI